MNTLTQRHKVLEAVQTLSDEAIDELANFIAYLQYKSTSDTSLTQSDDETLLDPGKTYEVWTPIDAPEAAATLMSLLAAEQLSSND
jgi:hypothetical protein